MIPESGRLLPPLRARRYKHWIRSVNARLRTQTVSEPFDSIAREKPILAAVPFVRSFFHIFFPLSLFFLSIEIYRVRFFFSSCNLFFPSSSTIQRPRNLASIHRSIDRPIVNFVRSAIEGSRGGDSRAGFFFPFSLPPSCIFLDFKGISLM